MRQVSDRLLVGSSSDAHGWDGPLVSACQSWHYQRIGCTRKNPPAKDRADYIVAEGDGWLSLNWVDGPEELFEWGGTEPWTRAFDFIDRQTDPVLVHCDKGQSRSPTLTLAYLARRASEIPAGWFPAVEAFQALYPNYAPNGIYFWLSANWGLL